jgi:hypothetical protein
LSLILLPILLAFLFAVVNFVFARFKPDFRFLWLIEVLGAVLIWVSSVAVLAVLPAEFQFYQWLHLDADSLVPGLLLDQISWPFTIGLASFLLLVEITFPIRGTHLDPLAKAGDFALAAAGLIAVQFGNLIALILSWAAIDLIEYLLVAHYFTDVPSRTPLIRGVSFRIAGILALFLCIIIGIEPASPPGFITGTQAVVVLLLLAAGFRLGVIPMNITTIQEYLAPSGLGAAIKIIPAAASLILLARMVDVDLAAGVFVVLLGLALFAGIYSSFAWLISDEVNNARPYWIVGMSSLSFGAALLNVPAAASAWALALIFGGGVIFLSSLRNRWFKVVLACGAILLAGIPFSPTWPGTLLFDPRNSWLGLIFIFPLFILLAGYLRFAFQEQQTYKISDRWRMAVYYFGFAIILLTYIVLGVWSARTLKTSGLGWSVILLVVMLLAWMYFGRRFGFRRPSLGIGGRFIQQIFSLGWMYQILGFVYRQASRLINLSSGLIEGEGGTLWSILLLVVLLSLLGSVLR